MANRLLDWVGWLSPGLMILIGAILFFLPLPPTSLIGIILIVVGAALWIVDYLGRQPGSGERRRGRQTGGD